MSGLNLDTGPSNEPVTLSEAKTHQRVDQDAEDDLIKSYITAARQRAEKFTNRVFVTQTWQIYFDRFPETDRIRLPLPPLQSITHVKYTNEDDSTSTFDSSKYRVNDKTNPGQIVLKNDENWPNPTKELKSVNAVEIKFDAGYGAVSDVPATIKNAIKLIVGHLYEHREEVVVGTNVMKIPLTAKTLLGTEKVYTSGIIDQTKLNDALTSR